MIQTTHNVIHLERPTFEVADILLSHILDYQKVQWLKPEQYKIVYDLLNCRTSYLGGHIEQCDHCGSAAASSERTCWKRRFFRASSKVNSN